MIITKKQDKNIEFKFDQNVKQQFDIHDHDFLIFFYQRMISIQ
jgi:hypothetical protein